ncbi:PH domain-containing protein [Streptomyces sp. CA-111067]|uniref:PH domain-containing protein n=1 Tax=Streptomyces sp. CA-111067 TaxID=3240046 RepID=UPI003D96273B
MTSQHTPTPPPGEPTYADRAYRSMAGLVSGVALIVVAGWLGGDAIVRGDGHTPWIGIAALLIALPLIVGFTLRPAVFANPRQIRVRNPFRTIEVPWEGVDAIRSSYSTEMLAGGRKFQIWAIPVSLRARKRAARQTARAKARGAEDPFGGSSRRIPGTRTSAATAAATAAVDAPVHSWSDQAVSELRELSEAREHPAAAADQPQPDVRWSYEIIAPAVAGVVALVVLLAVGG